MKDLVYTLGSGSNWKNNEIRFSLRSVFKNLSGYRNIFIIGEDPGFIKGDNIFFFPCPDIYNPNKNADGNIIHKLLFASKLAGLSEDFIFMNDDNYFLKPMHVDDIYPFHKGNMNDIDPSIYSFNHWGKRLGRTRTTLMSKGLAPLHFDHHAPFPMKKSELDPTYEEFDFGDDVGLTVKSIYGSIHYKDAPVMVDEKVLLRDPFTLDFITKRVKDCLYLANNDKGLNSSFKYFLYLNYPDAAPWETTPCDDKIVRVAEWFHNDKPYAQGSELFIEHYPMRKNLHKMYRNNDTYLIRKKIDYHLSKILRDL
jgi:hypothetical protein